jgi:hypothetical protein
MAYQTRMLFRMCLPALGVMAGAMVLAIFAGAFGGLVPGPGAGPLWPGLGDTIALGGLVCSLLVYAVQLFRYWRWTQGDGDCCYICTCLLGREQDGRFGPYRKCMGCGKNHALGRI